VRQAQINATLAQMKADSHVVPRVARRTVELAGPDDPRIAAASIRSPLEDALALSPHADLDELRFREEIEHFSDGFIAARGFFERKRVLQYLEFALQRTGVIPSGTVVELGAGSCWLSAALACDPNVVRVVAVEFSARRLREIAPASIALVDAPAEKIERRIADFYAHGLGAAFADLVVVDAAFHHAADPQGFARVAFDLLRPGGQVLLLREPTLAFLRRTRDHGIEGEHGDFEHEYRRPEYVAFLRRAGFDARSVGVRWFHTSGWRRVLYHPPLTWLSGALRGHYVYVGKKPG
jgi:SAM-dependent methyltransferase